MSEAPERIWVKESHDSWGRYGHWYSDSKGGGVEYVRADRIEELEAKLEGRKKLILILAGDKIDLVSDLAGVKFKLAKALEALFEAIYLLDPDEEDMAKKAGVYRIVTTFKELKGETDE